MLDDIDHLLDDAIALHEAKRFFSASAKYLKILKQDSLHADTNHNFGLLKVELGLKEEAYNTASVLGHNYPKSEWYKLSFNLVNQNSESRSFFKKFNFFNNE